MIKITTIILNLESGAFAIYYVYSNHLKILYIAGSRYKIELPLNHHCIELIYTEGGVDQLLIMNHMHMFIQLRRDFFKSGYI